jgi:hypothetical protein
MGKKDKQQDERPRVAVALIIEIDGSFIQNRLTAFELPIIRLNVGNDDNPGQITFDTGELKAAMIEAINKL